ncbi:MAG TPA: hypothetical protein VFM54_00050 [Micromonosporaceae bacterium]|nr:hypothetical protein [Micromonosporaceae bacterium]
MSDVDRSPEQAARETSLKEVAGTLLDIEQAIDRARRARRVAATMVGCDDLARVLNTAAERLEAARKELFQGAYLAGDQPRMF